MSDTDLCFMPATELAARIARRDVSSVEVTTEVLAHIAALEPTLNAFATATPELALKMAAAADKKLAKGDSLGVLHGVPTTIKDLVDVGGLPTERGSYIHKGNIAQNDTAFVSRLRTAGAVFLGKTTTSEFGWKGVSHSPLTGVTSNPWRVGFNAGASSAGAGAGAAAGFGPLHHGSDGAGSIRMPAHFCGVFGLKPTFGRIPNVPVRNNDQVSHNGPLTRTVADAALMLGVMAGPEPLDHYSLESPPADYAGELGNGIKGKRVAYSADLGHAKVDENIAAIVADAVRAFDDLGVQVESSSPAFGPDGPEIVRYFWAAHELELAKYLPEFGTRMDPGLVACIEDARNSSAVEYVTMRSRKLAYIEAIHRYFEEWDFLLTPAVSVAAFPAERLQPAHWPQHDWDWLSWAEFSYPFNMSGNPSAIVPAGFTEDGLPVGLQITGKRFDDLGVLQAAAAFEKARPWAQHRPALANSST